MGDLGDMRERQMLIDAPPRGEPEIDIGGRYPPSASALMVAGKNRRVRLKWKKAHSRLERTATEEGLLEDALIGRARAHAGRGKVKLRCYRAVATRPELARVSTASS